MPTPTDSPADAATWLRGSIRWAFNTGINRGTLTRIYHETAERLDIAVIDHLCGYLQCTSAELIEHVPEPSTQLLQN